MNQLPKSDQELDVLLHDLRFADDNSPLTHQAPMGLSRRIIAALPAEPAGFTTLFPILRSPLRALTAAAMPLLLGVVIGSATGAEELEYPDDDELLVLASLGDDLAGELTVNFAPSGSATTGSAPANEARQ